MNRKIITIIVFLIFFLKILNVNAQLNDYICYTDEYMSAGYLELPTNSEEPGQYLRILIIYVTFSDDNVAGPHETSYENIWLRPDTSSNGTRPLNPYTTDGRLIDTVEKSDTIPFMNRYREYTYSDWFCEMSQGKLDVIGDEIYFRLPHESEHYRTVLQWTRNNLNKWILRYVKNTLNVNYSRYDNWTYSGNVWSWGSDGNAEMIVIQFRRIPGLYDSYYWSLPVGGVGGEASLGIDSTIQLGSTYVRSGDGITASQGINRATRVMVVVEHEISHHIFGVYFDHPEFNRGHSSIGLMTEGHSNSTYTMLPMERSMPGLNWTNLDTVTSGNIQSSYALNDYISTGECLKVEIPDTNPKEYFWISNHQKVSKYDGISRGSNECWLQNKYEQDPFCDNGKGLYIFHESAIDCPNNVYSYVSGTRHYPFDLINAEGRYKWDTLRSVYDANLGNLKLMKEIRSSRDSGVSEFNKYKLNPSYWSAQLLTDDPCSDQINDYFITGDFHGDGLDAYNIGYDEIFSPYSNPSTRSCQNLSSNTGLTFNLINQDTSGAITLKIYFNDDSALALLPPSKPKNVKATMHSLGGGAFHPEISWDQNIEPDFYGGGPYNGPGETVPFYEIYRGSSSDCNDSPEYSYLTSVDANVTSYIDEEITLYTAMPSTPECPPTLITISYKILAKDSQGMNSLKSERALVSGYVSGCAEEDNRPITKNLELPDKFSIRNYPNPFNPVTKIYYSIPVEGNVRITIYNAVGQKLMEVVNEMKTAGYYSAEFNGSNLSSGVYFYRFESGSFVQTRKLLLLK